jgi:hypothetical protein
MNTIMSSLVVVVLFHNVHTSFEFSDLVFFNTLASMQAIFKC